MEGPGHSSPNSGGHAADVDVNSASVFARPKGTWFACLQGRERGRCTPGCLDLRLRPIPRRAPSERMDVGLALGQGTLMSVMVRERQGVGVGEGDTHTHRHTHKSVSNSQAYLNWQLLLPSLYSRTKGLLVGTIS